MPSVFQYWRLEGWNRDYIFWLCRDLMTGRFKKCVGIPLVWMSWQHTFASCNVRPTKKTIIIYEDIPACGSAVFCVEECGFNSWLCAKLMTCCNGSNFFSLVDALTDFELISESCIILPPAEMAVLVSQPISAFLHRVVEASTGFEASASFPAQVVGV